MIYTTRTPTVPCTCSKCGKHGTEGTLIGTQLRAGDAIDWNCPTCYQPRRSYSDQFENSRHSKKRA